MDIKSIDILISRLKKATIPLPVAKQVALGEWLEKFLFLHDKNLLTDVFIKIEQEARGAAKTDSQQKLL